MRSFFLVGIACSVLAWPASAEEQPITLKAAPGHETVETNCAVCHSLDYIQGNAPFLNGKGWEAEVSKMMKVYGAPISDADAKVIMDYLTANYGG